MKVDVAIAGGGLVGASLALALTGLKLNVAITWPVLLDGRIQLQLIVTGVVVWSSATETAMKIERHDFRTRSVGPKARSPQ